MAGPLPERRTPGKLAKTDSINAILDYLRGQSPTTGQVTYGGETGISLIVQVVNEGPDAAPDFSDNMYWGRVLYIKGGDPGPALVGDPLELGVDNYMLDGIVIPFTCLPEHQGVFSGSGPIAFTGTHALPMGSIVQVWPKQDVNGVLRWITTTLPRQITMVRITSNAAGGGKYNVLEQIPATDDISATGNASNAAVGTDGSIGSLLINPSEYGAGTHNLPADDVYVAYLIRINTDGTPVYLLTGTGGESTPPVSTSGLKYQVWMTVDDVGTKAWDWPRWKD